jgi:hypothetical protein
MIRRWHFLINQFLVATRNNYKKAVKLSRSHDNRLKKQMDNHPADTDYPIAYNRYHPLHLDLEAAYNKWKSKGGLQIGETLSLIQLLALLPNQIQKIDVKIQAIHEKGSTRWIQLFPNAHIPFYRGAQDTRIGAVNSLSESIGSEVALEAIKTEVDAIHAALVAAKTEQDGAVTTTDESSNIVEKARYVAMVTQYQNVGFFINKFPEDPDSIEILFDVETLTNPEQTIWKGHLDPLEIHPTLIRTFAAGDMMRLKSNGDGDIKAYLASTPGGIDSSEINITANHELIFDVADFHVTNYAVNRYLTIINKSSEKETRFLVELY